MMRPGSANHDYRDSNVLYLALLCSAVYFCSYLTRINYSAVLVEIITSEHYTKQAASAALTGMFISYGIFQPFSGFLGDHIKPEKVIMGGLLAAGLLNLLIAVCTSPVMMTVVWTANGVAQSMLWPPIVKIMAEKMITADYEKYLSWISVSAYISQILIYLAAPTVVHLSGWRMLFLLCGTFAMLMVLRFCSFPAGEYPGKNQK